MISLAFPKETENNYLLFQGRLMGPLGPNCQPPEGESIDFDLAKGKLFWQSPGLFQENNCGHDTVKGMFEYIPILRHSMIAASPTSQYPCRIAVTSKDKYNRDVVTYANEGFLTRGSTSYSYNTATDPTAIVHSEYFAEKGLWSWWTITENLGSPGHPRYYHLNQISKIEAFGKTQVIVYYRLTQYIQYDPTISGWYVPGLTTPLAWGAIQMILPRKIGSVYESLKVSDFVVDTNPYEFSPNLAIHFVSMLVDQYWPGHFPLKDRHYGDLAMEASSKVIANDVNMLQFLRDFRHPTQMIPKLKNLKSLKSYANDYLSVKYGLMLTIADLSTIFDAFKRMKANRDRNGFKTYSAGHIESQVIGKNQYQLEQHIKLGIGDEDQLFELLEEGLDMIGFLPTMEVIWDLVPYTFVIDWFVSLGGFLERLDSRDRLRRLNIRYVTMSRKSSVVKVISPSLTSPYAGELVWVHYHRWVSDQCPVPPLSLKSNILNFDHWIEGTALLLQRGKR